MKKKELVTIAIASVALVVSVITLYLTFQHPSTKQPAETPPSSTTSESEQKVLYSHFETASMSWPAGSRQQVSVLFDELPSPFPTALSLEITFDPEMVEVVDINSGNLWTDVNVLQEEIDNQKGEAIFAAGQGFSADTVQDNLIATVDLLVKTSLNSEEANLALGAESEMAVVGYDRTFPIKTSSVSIKLAE